MLRELETAATPPLTEVAAHLRLAQGFEGETAAIAALEPYARAAVAAVEGMTGKALSRRRFLWTESRWRDVREAAAPVAPVAQVLAVTVVTADGARTAVDPSRYALTSDDLRSCLIGARGGPLPAIPSGGRAEIEISAGYGDDWSDVPADLGQAVLMLCAHYHEQRHVAAEPAREAPFGVRAIVARHREVRL